MAIGLTYALYGLSAKPAVAGTWEPLSPNYSIYDCEPGNEAYEKWSEWIQGAASGELEFDWLPYIGADLNYIYAYPEGRAAFLQHKGRFGGRYRWVPNQIWDSGDEKYIEDPSDKPPPQVVFKMSANVQAGAWAGRGVSTGKAKATVSIMGVDFPSAPYGGNMWHGGTVIFASGSLTKFVVKKTNGETEITAPWASVLARAEVEGDRKDAQNSPALGSVEVAVEGGSEIVNRGVGITSTIDQSFRKSTSQPLAEPGQPPLPHIPGSNPPVWKEPVPLGEPVHSAAFWEEAGEAGWRGAATYYSHVLGLNGAKYQWRLEGGTPDVGSMFGVTNGPSSINEVIGLGGQLDGSGMTTSSTIKLNAQDTDGTVESNDYTVNWHLPIEDIEETGTPLIQYGLLPGTPRNGELGVLDPGESTQVILNPATAKAKLYLSSGEQVAVGIGGAILTRGASVAIGKYKPISAGKAAFALLGWFYKLEMDEFVNQPEYASITNTEDEWRKAVSITRDAINQVEGADIRVTPTDIALEEPSSTRWLGSRMTPWIKSTTKVTFTRADEYNGNGYVGRASGEIHGIEKVEAVGHYEYDGMSPTMR